MAGGAVSAGAVPTGSGGADSAAFFRRKKLNIGVNFGMTTKRSACARRGKRCFVREGVNKSAMSAHSMGQPQGLSLQNSFTSSAWNVGAAERLTPIERPYWTVNSTHASSAWFRAASSMFAHALSGCCNQRRAEPGFDFQQAVTTGFL
jgi:hypothetical protein